MTASVVATIIPDTATVFDIAEQACAGGLVLVEKDARTVLCPRDHIPAGWHVVGLGHAPARKATT